MNQLSGSVKGSLNIPSNVTRLTRAIKTKSSDGVPQIVYYHHGVGCTSGVIDKIYGGITGEGMYTFPPALHKSSFRLSLHRMIPFELSLV